MKGLLVLSALVSVAIARPGYLHPTPLPNVQSYSSASATAATPQQLSLLRLLPNGPDGQRLNSVELSLARAEQNAADQRAETRVVNENSLGLSPLLSASSSASASSVSPAIITADGRVLNTLEVNLARAAQSQALQASRQGANPLLSATRLVQSLASLSPTGASSSSSVQYLESPELSAARVQQQQAVSNVRQNLLLSHESTGPLAVQSNGLPLLVSSDGQLVGAPLLVL